MAVVLNFIPSEGNYRFDSELVTQNNTSGVYTFDVRWNGTDYNGGSWHFDMYDSNGILIVAGVKIVLNAYLGRRSAHPFFNDNILIAVDTSLDKLDPGFDDLGTRVQVWHLTTSDLAALVV
jgi:hypothetical protein